MVESAGVNELAFVVNGYNQNYLEELVASTAVSEVATRFVDKLSLGSASSVPHSYFVELHIKASITAL